MSYGDVHRYFLRTVASRGVLTSFEANELLTSFIGLPPSEWETGIKDLVREINKNIKPFKQTVKTIIDEVTEGEAFVFLSLGCDDATKSQNFFAETEFHYFRILLDEIMYNSESRIVSSITAVNLVRKLKASRTKIDAEKLLATWCRMHYLEETTNGYTLGVRGMHEFESHLRENMADTIGDCFLCKQIVFRVCNCPSCGQSVHRRCLNRYIEKVTKWPCCKIDYDPSQIVEFNTERLSTESTSDDTVEPTEGCDTMYEPIIQNSQQSDQVDLSQDTVFGVSQSVTRKRKRQN